MRIPRAVDGARAYLPLRAVLRFLRVSPSRFHAWRRQSACVLDDQSSCPRTSASRLTPAEIRAIEDMVTSPDYRHVLRNRGRDAGRLDITRGRRAPGTR
jgi:putative transposase